MQGYCDFGLQWSIKRFAGIVSSDILYLEGKSPLLMRNNQVKFVDMLPESNKNSAFWDMAVNSYLRWLLLFVLEEAGVSGLQSLGSGKTY